MSDFIIKANQYEKIANSGGVAKGMRRSRSQMSGVKHRAAAKSNNKAVVNEDISTSYYGNRPFDKMSEVLYYGKLNPQIAGEHLDILRGGSKPFTYEEIEFMAVWYLTAYDKFLGGWLDGSGQLRPMHFEEVTSKVENQQVSTMANTCTNPKQSNNWFILNLNNGIETNPPCGCYVNTNLGILDVIPFTKLFKLLGKSADYIDYCFDYLKNNDAYYQTALSLLDEALELGVELKAYKQSFNSRYSGKALLPPMPPLGDVMDESPLNLIIQKYVTEAEIIQGSIVLLDDFNAVKNALPGMRNSTSITFGSGTLFEVGGPLDPNAFSQLMLQYAENVNGVLTINPYSSYTRNAIIDANPGLGPYQIQEIIDDIADDVNQTLNNIEYIANSNIPTLENAIDTSQGNILRLANIIDHYRATFYSTGVQRIAARESELLQQAPKLAQAGTLATGFLSFLGLALFGVGRQKQCFDPRTRLNPDTCECECRFPSLYEVCPVDATASPLWGAPQWVWDNVVPMLPQSEEVRTCYKKCCDSQTAWVDSVGYGCGCNCFGEIPSYAVPLGGGAADSYFKSGTGAKCCRELQFSLLGGNWQRGSCVSSFEETRRTALGQVWDADKCEFICPNTGKPEGERCIPNETYPVSVTYVDGNGVSQTEDSLCYCSPYLDCETSANCYVGSMCECIHFSDTHCYCEYSPNAEYECNTRVYLGDCNAPCPDPAPGLELCGVTAYGVCCDGQLRDTIADGPCPSCS